MTPLATLLGLIRLVHPFPSLLCSLATAGIAALAGAEPEVFLRLGAAMLGIQLSIGALNDIVDAPLDASQKPRKPIPSAAVTRRQAGIVAALGGVVGIGLSALSGVPTAIAGLACLGLGYAYDLRLSRTALSWLPLSIALPLLPIHAWLGAAGTIPVGLLTLVPVGVLAGAGLALANGLADVDRDASVGRHAIAVALGRRGSWITQTFALACAAALAILLAPLVPAVPIGAPAASGIDPGALGAIRSGGIWVGVALLAAGAAVLASSSASARERGWELEAIGVACLGLGWLAGIAATA